MSNKSATTPGSGDFTGSERTRPLIVALIAGTLVGVTFILVVAFILIQRHRRRRRAEDPDSPPPRHLTRLERLALPEAAGVNAESIRALRQRRWAARHSNAGLTVDEIDLVAPVKQYVVGEKGGGGEGERWGDEEDDTCAVCLDDMGEGDKTRRLRCGHEFHADCIQAWVTKANRCPVCSVEPLDAACIAKRRNARSSTRRGIDAAISRERRRRTRGAGGGYELDGDGSEQVEDEGSGVGAGEGRDGQDVSVDVFAVAPVAPPDAVALQPVVGSVD